MLCQTKLNELLAGLQPIEEVEERVVEDNPDWNYSIEINPAGSLPLVAVRVTVTQRLAEGQTSLVRGKAKTFSLVRWLPDGGQWSPRDSEEAMPGTELTPPAPEQAAELPPEP